MHPDIVVLNVDFSPRLFYQSTMYFCGHGVDSSTKQALLNRSRGGISVSESIESFTLANWVTALII